MALSGRRGKFPVVFALVSTGSALYAFVVSGVVGLLSIAVASLMLFPRGDPSRWYPNSRDWTLAVYVILLLTSALGLLRIIGSGAGVWLVATLSVSLIIVAKMLATTGIFTRYYYVGVGVSATVLTASIIIATLGDPFISTIMVLSHPIPLLAAFSLARQKGG